MDNEDEYQVVVRSDNSEYEYEVAVKHKDSKGIETEMRHEESGGRKRCILILSGSLFIVVLILICIGVIQNNEKLILYGTAFSFVYGFFTSNFYRKYEKGFHNITGAYLDDRKFIAKLSIGIGAMVFLFVNFIADHIQYIMELQCQPSSELLVHKGIQFLTIMAIIFVLIDCTSKNNM